MMRFCCNSCGHIPEFQENRPYFMSSCGHIVCESCCRMVINETERCGTGGCTCPVCQTECRFADLTDPKPEIKSYFVDPTDTLKECLNRIVKVSQFQAAQTQRYNTQMAKLVEQYKLVQLDRDALVGENAALKTKVEALEQREQSWVHSGSGVLPMPSPRSGGNGGNEFFVVPQANLPLPDPAPSPFFPPAATNAMDTSPVFRAPVTRSQVRLNNSATKSPYDGGPRNTRNHMPTIQNVQSQRRHHRQAHTNEANRLFPSATAPPFSHGTGSSGTRPYADRGGNSNINFRSLSNHPPVTSSSAFHTNALLSRLQSLGRVRPKR